MVDDRTKQLIEEGEREARRNFTPEVYGARLKERLRDIAELMTVEEAAQDQLIAERSELEHRLSDLDAAFADAQARISELEGLLEREGNHLGSEQLERAEKALGEGDFDEADKLLAEIEDDEELAVKRAAHAAFGRGKIAEEQVQWHKAAKHYAKAARLDPTYDHLKSAREFAWRAGDYEYAEALGTELLRTARAKHGETSAEYATALNEHALTLRDIGRLAEAEPLYRQAIEIDKATIGPGHSDYAVRLSNLAVLLRGMGRLDEAEPLYRQAIEIDKATLGEEHPAYATRLNNLARLLQDRGRLHEAEPLFRHAIEIIRVHLGGGHPNYAAGLNNLANLLREMGRLDDAAQLFEQSLTIFRKALGDDHPNSKRAAKNRAKFLRATHPDDPELAEIEQIFGEDIGRE